MHLSLFHCSFIPKYNGNGPKNFSCGRENTAIQENLVILAVFKAGIHKTLCFASICNIRKRNTKH